MSGWMFALGVLGGFLVPPLVYLVQKKVRWRPRLRPLSAKGYKKPNIMVTIASGRAKAKRKS
jgi:hypothetical protein